MRSIVGRLSTVVLFLAVGVSAGAQTQPVPRRPMVSARPGVAVRRERMIERRIAQRAAMRVAMRAEMRAGAAGPRANRVVRAKVAKRRAAVRAQTRAMTPAQRQQLQASRQALRVERQRIGEQLRNGSITQEQGRQRMLNWRREHRPNANLGLRGPRRPGEGEF